MGIEDLGTNPGYLNNSEVEYAKVKAVIEGAIQHGIYVIVDWHETRADTHIPEATEFFRNISQTYGSYPHILYEIWNEPDRGVNWTTIKSYAEQIIPVIRANAPNSIVVVGTQFFSQDVDIAAEDPLDFPNVAYTLHYYAAAPSQQQPLRDRAIIAINKGICVFITEYGTVFYTGLGAVDVNASEVWWEFNDLHKLSYVNWAIMDNNPNSEPNNTGANALTQNSIVDQMGMPSHWTTSGTLVNQKYHTTNQGVNGNCPPAWYLSDVNSKNCYNFINFNNLTWNQANDYCASLAQRASLISIDNAFENSEVTGVVQNYAINCSQAFIGLKKSGNNWNWVNGDSGSYRNWENGYPITDSNSLCSVINKIDGKWENVNCNQPQCFVCKLVV